MADRTGRRVVVRSGRRTRDAPAAIPDADLPGAEGWAGIEELPGATAEDALPLAAELSPSPTAREADERLYCRMCL